MSEDWARWQGQVVDGEFRLGRYLGGTEHSSVFLTEFAGKPAAIKLIPEQSRPQWGAELSHAHLIPIFTTGSCQVDGISLSYVVMEYAEEVLSRVIPERALEPEEARETILPVLDVLSYLHGEGLIHGRIKPSNILSAGDRLKLSSDGLRRPGETGDLLKSRGPYDAPEIASGRVTPAADIWSLGVTMVEMLTQRLPVKDGAGEPVLPESLPPDFREIAARCLDPDPQRRSSLSAISARLSPDAPAPSQVITMPPPRVPPEPAQTGGLQRSHWMAAIGVVVAAVVIYAGTVAFRSRPSPVPAAAPPAEASREVTPAPPPPPEEKPSPAGRVRGKVATDSKPDISRTARDTIQGTVRIRVTVKVDPSGKVVETKLDTPRVSRYFTSAALQAARRWRFFPPTVEGRAVPSSWVLEFDLTRSGTTVHSREIS